MGAVNFIYWPLGRSKNYTNNAPKSIYTHFCGIYIKIIIECPQIASYSVVLSVNLDLLFYEAQFPVSYTLQADQSFDEGLGKIFEFVKNLHVCWSFFGDGLWFDRHSCRVVWVVKIWVTNQGYYTSIWQVYSKSANLLSICQEFCLDVCSQYFSSLLCYTSSLSYCSFCHFNHSSQNHLCLPPSHVRLDRHWYHWYLRFVEILLHLFDS